MVPPAPEEGSNVRRLVRTVKRLEPAEFRLLSLMATGLLRLRLMRQGRASRDSAPS